MESRKRILLAGRAFGYAILAGTILFGCGTPSKDVKTNSGVNRIDDNFSVIVVDSCEYIVGSYDRMTHKGNCKFCERRVKKLLYDYYIDECNF
jgi:hypothetical protein